MFNVYDFDRFSKHDQIGQIQVPLGSVDLARVIEEWRDLSPPDDDEKVSLCSVHLVLAPLISSFMHEAIFFITSVI